MAEEKTQQEEAAVEAPVEDQAEEKAKPKRRRRPARQAEATVDVQEEPQAEVAETEQAEEPKQAEPNPKDEVRVRFHGEMGIIAGQVVRDGFVVSCLYHQYLEARETGGDAYELV